MTKRKILVTGSSGMIGTRLCETLITLGYEVAGADIAPNIWNSEIQKRTVMVDLRDRASLEQSLPTDVDLVVHLAANARVYNLVKDPLLARDNFEMTFNVLEFVRTHHIEQFLFASSRETYGNSEKVLHSEEDAHIELCESPYTASKIGGEALVHAYKNCYGLKSVIVRLSNVYGMYDRSDRIVPLFISYCKSNRDLVVYGKEKVLDFTYIDDCIKGLCHVIADFHQAKHSVYNIAYGEGTSLIEVAQMILEFTKSQSNIVVEHNRVGEVVQYIADITKVKNDFNFSPSVPIREGLQKATQWYNEHDLRWLR